jgi:CubicO group peptidase (beta-lactamase class C family)
VRGQPIAAGDLQAFVDGQVARALSTDHVAGVVVSVVQNGQLVMEKGYGRASLDPAKAMDPRATLVRLGSASQTFTWIAALKAVEEGKLDLSKPANAYLPDALRLPDEGFRQQVTVSQLMSRTAGFEDRRFGRRYTRDASRIEALEAALQDQRPRRVREAGLVSIPSDYGAALAGEIVARVEGKPFDQLIETEILRPLGLNHTSFREPYPAAQGLPDPLSETLANQVGSEFHWNGHGLEPQPFAYGESLAPAIAASTTADDMARLMIALLNNGALGNASLYGPRIAALLAQPLQAPAPGAAGSAHGLMSITLPGAGAALFERGAGAASHSELLLVPGMNLGVFVAANTDSGAALVASLPSTLAEHFAAAAPQSAWTAPADWSSGTYLSANRASHGLEAFVDRLIFVTHLGSDGAGGLILKDARTTQHFAHTDTDGLYAGPEGQTLYLPGGAADRPAHRRHPSHQRSDRHRRPGGDRHVHQPRQSVHPRPHGPAPDPPADRRRHHPGRDLRGLEPRLCRLRPVPEGRRRSAALSVRLAERLAGGRLLVRPGRRPLIGGDVGAGAGRLARGTATARLVRLAQVPPHRDHLPLPRLQPCPRRLGRLGTLVQLSALPNS